MRRHLTERAGNEKKNTTAWIARGAVISAIYVVLTLAFAPISYGSVQVRIAEALTILPLFTSAAVPGLFIGCLLANILGGAVIWDIVFGSIATLIGAAAGRLLRHNRWLVPLPAVLSNTLIIPLVLRYGYGVDIPFWIQALYILAGEILGCYLLGEVLASVLLRYRKDIFK